MESGETEFNLAGNEKSKPVSIAFTKPFNNIPDITVGFRGKDEANQARDIYIKIDEKSATKGGIQVVCSSSTAYTYQGIITWSAVANIVPQE